MIHQSIITGTELPELTNPGTANDLLAGKQLIDQFGNPLTGTIATKTQNDLSVSGSSIIVPAGYYVSQTSKSVATATQATPSISVSSSGLITASATQSAGYVSSGTKRATKQLTTQAGKTITPGRTQQTAVSSGRYTTGAIYVAGDTDLTAANIKKGVNIFGVTGTYEGGSMTRYDVSSQLGNPSLGYSSGGTIIDIIYSISSSLYTTLTNAKMVFVRFHGRLSDDNYDTLLGAYGVYLRIDDYEYDDNAGFRQTSYGIGDSSVSTFFHLTTSKIELSFSAGTSALKNQITLIEKDNIDVIYWN